LNPILDNPPEHWKIYCRSCGVEVNTEKEQAEVSFTQNGYVIIKCSECWRIVKESNGHFDDYDRVFDEQETNYKDDGKD
jgi:predicted RNA-binding Zn-ribbon protein involved in translation (DUF1610 family)